MVSLEFFIGVILLVALWSWGGLSPLQKWVPALFSGGKGSRCIGLTTLPPSCADCLEIWEPQPPGTHRAYNEISLPFTRFKEQLPLQRMPLLWERLCQMNHFKHNIRDIQNRLNLLSIFIGLVNAKERYLAYVGTIQGIRYASHVCEK